LFDAATRAQFVEDDKTAAWNLGEARVRCDRAKDARRTRSLARAILWVIGEVGGMTPTPERAQEVALEVENELAATEDELLQLRATISVERYRKIQAELHGSAAILSALSERKARAKQKDRADPCIHQAVLAGQLEQVRAPPRSRLPVPEAPLGLVWCVRCASVRRLLQALAVVAQYQGAEQLKRRHRRMLRASQATVSTCDELLEHPYRGVAAFLHTEQAALRAQMADTAAEIGRSSALMVQRKFRQQQWEVARGGRAFASMVIQRHVTIDFTIRVAGKKKSALKKLHQLKRVGAGFLPAVVPPLQRRLVVLGADSIAKADFITGSSDPYAVVYWVGEKGEERLGQTSVLKRNLCPKWGLPLPLAIPYPAGGLIRVEIYDYDAAGEHDFLGIHLATYSQVQRIRSAHTVL
jgi:ElaB/YqjD/DUF883 family membrane-anchored ribosome-binding protein/soluble P-type ATPase